MRAIAQRNAIENNVCQWIIELSHPSTRENALFQLCQIGENIPNLARMLWHSFGTVAALLQQITSVYPFVSPPNLSVHQSNRVCSALTIMECMTVHPETKFLFLQALIPLFLYPFLQTTSHEMPFEHLRFASLGIIRSLVDTDSEEVISFLISTRILPLILRIIETGPKLSQTLATFILQRILISDNGLMHVCQTFERFSHVAMILGQLVLMLALQPSVQLLKLIYFAVWISLI